MGTGMGGAGDGGICMYLSLPSGLEGYANT